MNARENKTKSSIGSKAYHLDVMASNGFNVPEFESITKETFDSLVETEVSNDYESMRSLLYRLEIDSTFVEKLASKIDLESNCLYAVRSSATEEDGEKHSYAGQFDSFLNVDKKDIAKTIIKVWQSAYSQRVKEYRKTKGIETAPELPAVIIQEMVHADIAGVAFSLDPVTGNRSKVVINSVDGLADKLVDGSTNGASYVMNMGRLESYEPGEKTAGEALELPAEETGKLTDWQLRKLVKTVKLIEMLFESPQDIEWAYKENQLFILQARRITTIESPEISTSQIVKRVDIWDNSNIGESYPGITTPLTFSFARYAYQNVYLQFCLLMGVSKKSIEENSQIFPQMLGFIQGRIYYNLLNWYRLLMLFPGYKVNESFMEQMMGVGESIDKNDLMLEEESKAGPIEITRNVLVLSMASLKLMLQYALLNKNSKKFYARLNTALSRVPQNLNNLHVVELVSTYRKLEDDLLKKWDAPIVNDFFAMIFYGLLKSLSSKWLEDDGIHNQLLCGETGIISTEPTRLLEELATMVRGNEELAISVTHARISKNITVLKHYPQFLSAFNHYLEKFGDRSAGELKLESKTLNDDPTSVLIAIEALANREVVSESYAQKQREEAERKMNEALKSKKLKKFIFKLVLDQARERIKARENLRFERTRVFAAVRQIFRAIGSGLASKGILDNRDDIFYLEVDEVLRYVEGTSTTRNLKEIARVRKQEFDSYKNLPAPPDRIRTVNGAEYEPAATGSQLVQKSVDTFGCLTGKGCCPGIIRGRVRVVTDPNSQTMEGFDILVAERTDPGWITVISQAKGIVVEYGSLLSHTAIVARELGIPTIVAATGVTKSLATGDQIELNGLSGQVQIVSKSRQNSDSGEVA